MSDPVNVITYHRSNIGLTVNISRGDSLEALNRQLLARQYQNYVRLQRLTNYFVALQRSILSSNDKAQCITGYDELRRIYGLAAQTEGRNPDMASWARPRFVEVSNHINSLPSTTPSPPLPVNPCTSCSNPGTCHANWARTQASIDRATLYRPPCGGLCGDPQCGNGWEIGRASMYMREQNNHVSPPSLVTDPPIIPVYPIETAVAGAVGGRAVVAIADVLAALRANPPPPLPPGPPQQAPVPPPGFSRVEYPRGPGAGEGAFPAGYTRISRWIGEEEARIWLDNGATRIPPDIGTVAAPGRTVLYVTRYGVAQPGGTGPIRVDMHVPESILGRGSSPDWPQILQPVPNVPIYNVRINYP